MFISCHRFHDSYPRVLFIQCSVDVESMREFEKEGSKKNMMSKAASQGSENARWYEAERGRERERVCVCVYGDGMALRELLDIACWGVRTR